MHIFLVVLICLVGGSLRSEELKSLSPAEHGERQLRKMLVDVPQMARHPRTGKKFSIDEPVFLEVIDLFGGAVTGIPVFWDPELPVGPADANHTPPHSKSRAKIRFHRIDRNTGAPFSFDRLWSLAVFELVNVQGWKQFHQLEIDASLGRIDREQYVEKVARVEYEALQKQKRFLLRTWAPFMLKQRLTINQWNWTRPGDSDFETWFSLCAEDSPYRNYYRSFYDRMQLNAEVNLARSSEAEFESMLKNYLTPPSAEAVLKYEAYLVRKEDIEYLIDRMVDEREKRTREAKIPRKAQSIR